MTIYIVEEHITGFPNIKELQDARIIVWNPNGPVHVSLHDLVRANLLDVKKEDDSDAEMP